MAKWDLVDPTDLAKKRLSRQPRANQVDIKAPTGWTDAKPVLMAEVGSPEWTSLRIVPVTRGSHPGLASLVDKLCLLAILT